uniref:Serpentine receptor class gamma n=2 Tax=Meloidogyne enterolobii TaxID=390850 RepID=A0A6V7VSK4_MELEN|nr:unnamed protein product [Meloidogyne enterolobii]
MSSTSKSAVDIYIGQTIGAIISVPSVLLYLIECWTIVRNWKQFNSSFYKLFLLSAFNNIFMNFIPSIIFARLIRLGWINNYYLGLPNWGPNLLIFLMFYNYHCENFITISTLLHRLSVIAKPFDYEKLAFISSLCGILIFFGPLLFTYRFGYWPLIFDVNKDDSVEIVMNIKSIEERPLITNYMVMLMTSIGYLFVNILLNLAVYLIYRKKQSNLPTNTANDKSSRLLVYTIAIFFAQLLLCLFWLFLTIQVLGNIFTANFNLILSNQYIWLSDLRTVAFPAWFLLWASTELNDKIRQKFPWIPTFKSSKVKVLNNSVQAMGVGGLAKVNVVHPVRSYSSSNSQISPNKRQSVPTYAGIQNNIENCGINGCELRK